MKKRKTRKSKNKPDLILELAKKQGLSQSQAGLCFDLIQNELTQALLRGRRVELRGFGTFCVRHYKGYKGHNPKTQERITVKAKKRPHFKPGIFKEILNP